jgi:LAO/AO transport system kinase
VASPVAGGVRRDGAALGRRLRAGDVSAAPEALNLIEDRGPAQRAERAALLAQTGPRSLGGEAPAHLVGVTGPPGAGKSSLLSALLARWRRAGRSVAILAVDPSSRRSGGSLLGDRARIQHDPEDDGVLIRSTAAGRRLGGLAPPTRESAQALACAFDLVVVETVGVGQSETDVAELCDTVVVVVQPDSGDTLQFLKAGLMEVPHALVVSKADLGRPAERARDDLVHALGVLGAPGTPVLLASSLPPARGVDEVAAALDAHRARVDAADVRPRGRRLSALAEFEWEHGEAGLRRLGGRRAALLLLEREDPWLEAPALVERLERRAAR